MPTLMYDGTATEPHTEPAVPKRGRDGKIIKRVYSKPAVVTRRPASTWKLWGHEFPAGVPVEVNDPALVRKAVCLEGFHFEGPESWLHEERPTRARDRRRNALAAAKAKARAEVMTEVVPVRVETLDEEQPKKRGPGRPKKLEA